MATGTLSNMNFDSIQSAMGGNIKRREAAIEKATSDPEFGNDTGAMLRLNLDMAYLNVTVSATANIIKEIGETMKGVVQKAA